MYHLMSEENRKAKGLKVKQKICPVCMALRLFHLPFVVFVCFPHFPVCEGRRWER